VGAPQVPQEVKLQKEISLALIKGSTVFINYLAALYVFLLLTRLRVAHLVVLSPAPQASACLFSYRLLLEQIQLTNALSTHSPKTER
jgi:hypothetical protein